MERALLVEKDKDPELWDLSHDDRHSKLNVNYSDFALNAAGFSHKGLKPEFYLTETEKKLLTVFKKKQNGSFNVLWQLSGSSWHKMYPHASDVIEDLLEEFPDMKVFMTGGDHISTQAFTHPRLESRIKLWGPRQAMAMTSIMDCVVSPETGVLNAAGAFDTPKIGLLTHSSKENLTKYFVNDYSIQSLAPCSPCHRMVHDLADCPLDAEFGLPICMSDGIDPEAIKETVRLIHKKWSMKMKGKGGGSLQEGLSEQHGINTSNKANGMDTVGKDQKPQAVPREKVSEKGKNFSIC
jgi:hypothetical protein